jgi:hypothetical protein
MFDRLAYNLEYFFRFLKRGQLARAVGMLMDYWESGCTEPDVWDLHADLLRYVLPRLRLFRRYNVNSFPMGMTFEQWKSSQDDMIFALELVLDNDHPASYYTEEVMQRYRRGLELFGKYLPDLWD